MLQKQLSNHKRFIRYLLTLPIRLLLAALLTLLAMLFVFAVGHHYFIAKALKSYGEEAQVFISKKLMLSGQLG